MNSFEEYLIDILLEMDMVDYISTSPEKVMSGSSRAYTRGRRKRRAGSVPGNHEKQTKRYLSIPTKPDRAAERDANPKRYELSPKVLKTLADMKSGKFMSKATFDYKHRGKNVNETGYIQEGNTMNNFEEYLINVLFEAAKEGGGEEDPKRTPKEPIHPDTRSETQKAQTRDRESRAGLIRAKRGQAVGPSISPTERDLQQNLTPAQRVNVARRERGMALLPQSTQSGADTPRFGAGVEVDKPEPESKPKGDLVQKRKDQVKANIVAAKEKKEADAKADAIKKERREAGRAYDRGSAPDRKAYRKKHGSPPEGASARFHVAALTGKKTAAANRERLKSTAKFGHGVPGHEPESDPLLHPSGRLKKSKKDRNAKDTGTREFGAGINDSFEHYLTTFLVETMSDDRSWIGWEPKDDDEGEGDKGKDDRVYGTSWEALAKEKRRIRKEKAKRRRNKKRAEIGKKEEEEEY